MAKFVFGKDFKLYYDPDGVNASSWTEATNIKDLTLNLEKSTDDVTVRGSGGWRQMAAAIKDGSTEFEMVYDPTDPAFIAFNDAFFDDSKNVIGVAVMDGDITVSGKQGLKADMQVSNFTVTQPLEEAGKVQVTIQPTFSGTQPIWYIVP